ncbi:MAG: Hypoxanthine-guanine phosphoribosyltransferase, partial [uncultured Nocardioidaceae bacterium]
GCQGCRRRPHQCPLHGGGHPAQAQGAGRGGRAGLRGPRPPDGGRPAGCGDGDGRPRAVVRAPCGDGLDGRLVVRLGDQVLRRRPDPQGSRHRHQRPPRAHRRGHHRHRADAVVARVEPEVAQARVGRDLHAPAQARRPADERRREVRRPRHPQRLRRRLRPRLRRAVPQPAVHRHPRPGGLLL